jgi:large subunit ribosomal protein L30e
MTTEIKKLLGTPKLIIGTDRVLKAVRKGGVTKVLLASNAPSHLRTGLAEYQKLAGFALEETGMTNDELGTICKKPFSIAALAILS